MNTSIVQDGTKNALAVRRSSENDIAGTVSPKTLGDLLAMWADNPPRQASMLRTTCVRLADYHGLPVEKVAIDEVEQGRKGFRQLLERRKYGENSVRTYVNHVRILINYAKDHGWQHSTNLSLEWRQVLDRAEQQNCAELARYLEAHRGHPREVTSEDVDRWVSAASQNGLRYGAATKKRLHYWRIVRDFGYLSARPKCLLREKNYGIPVDEFPPGLKQEVTELLKWKQAAYSWDRPRGARHRPPTAKRLRHVICGLYGFAVNIAEVDGINSLEGLVQEHIVGAYIEWCMAERGVKGQTLQRNLRLLDGTLRQRPRYKGESLDWFKGMLDNVPIESEASLKKRRAERVMDYSEIAKIPGLMHAERASVGRKGEKQLAVLVRDELIIRWLSVLPWRQRNLRECRIGGSNPNLHKGPVPLITTIDMPRWAAEERKKKPGAEFWQFHFSEEETKTGCVVDALLPRQLIGLLEDYLDNHRNHLLADHDPGTLFLNRSGKPMSIQQVDDAVCNATLKYAGRRVTPHPFRDMVAFAWLKDHPQDYLTLSKLLWHANPNEVIKTYGSLFNESSGVCRMESWLEEREAAEDK